MVNGSVIRSVIAFALPLIFSCILQMLFNAADSIVVGRFAGDDSLAAVGSTAPLINLLTNLFTGLSLGSNVLAARYKGAGDKTAVNETVHTSMLLGLMSGLLLTVLFLVFAPRILITMQTPESVLPLATLYVRIYALGMSPMMVYNFGAALLRSKGDTKRPLIYLSVAGVINIFLNLFFVIVLKMDVAGVATATAISQTFSAYLIVKCLCGEADEFHMTVKGLRIYKKKLIMILRIGIPAGIQGTLFAVSNVVIQSAVNTFGSTVVAAGAAASNIEAVVYFITYGFDQSAVSFVSQNVGAGRYDRLKKIITSAVLLSMGSGLIAGVLAAAFARPLISIFSENSDVIAEGVLRMGIICISYIICGSMDTIASAIRGLGYSLSPTVLILIFVCGFRILWVFYCLSTPSMNRSLNVYASYPLSWAIATVAELICFAVVWKKSVRPRLG